MQTLKEKLSQDDLEAIATLYKVSASAFKDLDGYESYVIDTGDTVLKINSAQTTEHDKLLAEAEFIYHLASHGLSVAKAIPSVNRHLVETYDLSDDRLFISQFEKVNGESPNKETANEKLFQDMGKLLGKLHNLSKSHIPSGQARNAWHEDAHIKNWQRNLSKDDPAKPAIESMIKQLESLDKTKDSYGLIHADFHSDNLVLNKESLTLIDFGDCLYGWFAMDIATAMFYYKRFLAKGHKADSESKQNFAKQFYTSFMQGYLEENNLSAQEQNRIPEFYQWRYVDLYLYLKELEQDGPLDSDELEALEEFQEIIQHKKATDFDWVKDTLS